MGDGEERKQKTEAEDWRLFMNIQPRHLSRIPLDFGVKQQVKATLNQAKEQTQLTWKDHDRLPWLP